MSEQSPKIDDHLIQRFVDGEVTEDQDRAIRLHLRDNSGARLSVQELLVLRRMVCESALAPVSPPAGFAARVAREAFLEKGEAVREFQRVLPTVKRMALLAAAAGLLLGVAWFWNQRMSETTPADELQAQPIPTLQTYNQNPYDEYLDKRPRNEGTRGPSSSSMNGAPVEAKRPEKEER